MKRITYLLTLLCVSLIVKSQDSLIAHYSFNGNCDQINGGYDIGAGVPSDYGVSYVAGINGEDNTAIQISREEFGHVNLGNNDKFQFANDEYTLSLWVKINSAVQYNSILVKGDTAWSPWDYGIMLNYGSPYTGTNGNDLNSLTPINFGEWHHLVATYNNGHHKLYINKVKKLDKQNIIINVSDGDLVLGQKGSAGPGDLNYNYDGAIDELKIFDKALEQGDINELFAYKNSSSECSANFTFIVDETNTSKVTFTDSSLPGTYSQGESGKIDNWTFDFGDGEDTTLNSNQIGAGVTHIYTSYETTFTASLTISGTDCENNYSQEIFIDSPSEETCQAGFNFENSEDSIYKFTSSSTSDSNGIIFDYDFGDGVHSSEENPSKTYSQSGTYVVCLTIIDTVTNCVSNYCETITVLLNPNDNYCSADFSVIPLGGKKYEFQNNSLGTYSEVSWDFNGGQNSLRGDTVEHEFPSAGYFDVCLTVFDETTQCLNSICKNVQISDENSVNCKADFEVFNLGEGKINFDSKIEGNYDNFYYSLGDGKYKNDELQFLHQYAKSGQYDVCMAISKFPSMAISNFPSCLDQLCKKVNINIDGTTITNAKMDFHTDTNGVTHFVNLSTGDYDDSHWDFGDGYNSNTPNATHSYSKSGFYDVCLNVYDAPKDISSKVCRNVYIEVNSVKVNCSANFDFMVINKNVIFQNTSLGDITNNHWKFDDYAFDNKIHTMHPYTNFGAYEVCLDILDTEGCQDNICREVIISENNESFCNANFEYFQKANGEIKFQSTSIGNTDSYWDLGNGVNAHHDGPIGNYPNEGVYSVSLTVWNTENGCQSSKTKQIVISEKSEQPQCNAKFDYLPLDGSRVKFNNTSQGIFTDVRWDLGDGNFKDDVNSFNHDFSKGGFQKVCLSVYDENSGCQDRVCQNVELFLDTDISDCHASFGFFPKPNLSEVVFNNTSTGQFTNSYWKLSNGTISYEESPAVKFQSKGLFGACLTVFDAASGCQDEFCVEIPLIGSSTVYCNAQFEYFVDGRSVNFSPEIKGTVTDWMWDYGDGFNSNDSFPQHTYQKDGVYEVCLTVFDSASECLNTYCDYVSIITDLNDIDNYVEADFSYYLNQIDGKVHFKDESVGNPNSWYWDFGDGDSAGVTQDPVYGYFEDGYYEVCLTAKNENGGQETKCQIISVGDVSNACFAKFDVYANAKTSTAHFDNNSLGTKLQYQWDFGDDFEFVDGVNPNHTYDTIGPMAPCLTVSNDSGCVRTYCKKILIGNALENPCLIGCVWPGDANKDRKVNHYDILPIGIHFGETGPKRDTTSIEWLGHESQDWSKQLWGDVNNKHGDANGDGIINLDDTLAIHTHFETSTAYEYRAQTANQLSIDWDADNIDFGDIAVITVSVPDSIDVSMYGIGFEIDLDPNVFDYESIIYDFKNSWLGTEDDDLITFNRANADKEKIYIAETRNDHKEMNGNGELVKIYVTAKSKSTNTGAILTTEGGITAEGDTVEFNGSENVVNVISIDSRSGYRVKELIVFPNPTTNRITYNLPIGVNSANYDVEIFDNIGALVFATKIMGGGLVNQSFEDYQSGIYTLQVSNAKIKYLQKIIVTK